MSESSWPLVFSEGNSNTVDGSASLEELLNSPLLGSESEVSDENGGNIFTNGEFELSGDMFVDCAGDDGILGTADDYSITSLGHASTPPERG